MLRDEPASIRLVAADRVAEGPQRLFNRFGDHTHTTRAVPIAQHEFRPRSFVLVTGRRWHRMAINQHCRAKIAMQTAEKPAQSPMIRLVEAFDALQGIVDWYALVVDFLGIANHSRDGSKASGYTHRPGIGEGRQAAIEHPRIELVWLAVHVDKTAGEVGAHHRIAAAHDARDEL